MQRFFKFIIHLFYFSKIIIQAFIKKFLDNRKMFIDGKGKLSILNINDPVLIN